MDSVVPSQRVQHRRWPLHEKRRIVELTQREGASVGAVAREHGVHPTVVSTWRKLFREGKLAEQSPRETARNTTPTTFLPVTMSNEDAGISSVQITLPSGVVLQIDTPRLDAEVLCALLAQVQR